MYSLDDSDSFDREGLRINTGFYAMEISIRYIFHFKNLYIL